MPIWLCYAVCDNRRMYAVTQQERESTVSDEMFLAGSEVPYMALLCGLLGFIKTAGAEKYRSCRKYDILQFRFIDKSIANRLCVIVSAPSDLRKAVLFIQLFCRLVITADFKKNAFYAVIFAFIYKIFH